MLTLGLFPGTKPRASFSISNLDENGKMTYYNILEYDDHPDMKSIITTEEYLIKQAMDLYIQTWKDRGSYEKMIVYHTSPLLPKRYTHPVEMRFIRKEDFNGSNKELLQRFEDICCKS